VIKLAIAFGLGVGAGLYIAKLYARNAVGDAIHQGLDAVGAGGGKVEEIAKKVIVPLVA
jgi:hypothetical protein